MEALRDFVPGDVVPGLVGTVAAGFGSTFGTPLNLTDDQLFFFGRGSTFDKLFRHSNIFSF